MRCTEVIEGEKRRNGEWGKRGSGERQDKSRRAGV
jgi:hypothetical protein